MEFPSYQQMARMVCMEERQAHSQRMVHLQGQLPMSHLEAMAQPVKVVMAGTLIALVEGDSQISLRWAVVLAQRGTILLEVVEASPEALWEAARSSHVG